MLDKAIRFDEFDISTSEKSDKYSCNLSVSGNTPEEARENLNKMLSELFSSCTKTSGHEETYDKNLSVAMNELAQDLEKAKKIQEYLNMDSAAFLKAITYELAPETVQLAGPAIPSPEGNATLLPNSLAYDIFDEDTLIHETAVEADRTFTGLLLYKAVRNHQDNKPPEFFNMSDDTYSELVKLTNDIVKNEHDDEVMLYALAAQDLGKTLKVMEDHSIMFQESARDHDHMLYELTKHHSNLFPGFEKLPDQNKTLYLRGLDSDLNLGQMVQGENLPCNLQKMIKLDSKSSNIRLLTEFYDFAGAAGHVKPGFSILGTDDNFNAYNLAIQSLNLGDSLTAYTSYIKSRGVQAGIINQNDNILDDKEKFTLCRLTALTRIFKEEDKEHLVKAWSDLSNEHRNILTYEMAISGLKQDEQRGILIYYSPGMIDNAVKNAGGFEKALPHCLKALANTYKTTRDIVSEKGFGQTTVDVNDLAKLAKVNFEAISKDYKAIPVGPFKRLTLEL